MEAVMRPFATVFALLAVALGLVACKSLPGADGQYATRDRGQNNRGAP